MARVVFLGTPQAAVPTLRGLEAGHDIALVVTQPDRPRGRSGEPVAPPVKQHALDRGLPVAQPESRAELAGTFERHGPFEVGVVVAYGRILRPEILEAPAKGLLNVHFSLLPRWRGAAPVARALMAGDPMTGVTIMKLDEGLDTGPVLTARAIDIPADDDAGRLTERLAELGAGLLVATLPRYLSGEMQPITQSDDGATYADKIERDERPIDPGSDAATVVAKVRGLAPSPGATLVIDGETHKILAARTTHDGPEPGEWQAVAGNPVVGLPDGGVEITSLQPPGKNRQSGADWVRGRRRQGGRVG